MWSCGCVFCVFIQVTSHCAWFIVGSIGHWSAISSHLLKLFSRTIRFFNKQRLNSEELGLVFIRKIRCVFFSIPRQLLKCALQARDFLKAQHFSIWTALRVWLEVHRWPWWLLSFRECEPWTFVWIQNFGWPSTSWNPLCFSAASIRFFHHTITTFGVCQTGELS